LLYDELRTTEVENIEDLRTEDLLNFVRQNKIKEFVPMDKDDVKHLERKWLVNVSKSLFKESKLLKVVYTNEGH